MTTTTRTEWSVEYYLFQPGNYAAAMSEKEARSWAAAHPDHARVVSRTVTESDWELSPVTPQHADPKAV